MCRVLSVTVNGSRGFNDFPFMERVLDDIFVDRGELLLIEGGAKGADRLAKRYALERGIDHKLYEADWDTLGKRAGFVRNIAMIKDSGLLIAFWDGESKGTKHAIDFAVKDGCEVIVVLYNTTATTLDTLRRGRGTTAPVVYFDDLAYM